MAGTVLTVCHERSVRELGFDDDESDYIQSYDTLHFAMLPNSFRDECGVYNKGAYPTCCLVSPILRCIFEQNSFLFSSINFHFAICLASLRTFCFV